MVNLLVQPLLSKTDNISLFSLKKFADLLVRGSLKGKVKKGKPYTSIEAVVQHIRIKHLATIALMHL